MDISKTPQIVLLDNKSENKIREKIRYGILYCLKNSSKIQRADVVKSGWKKGEIQKEVLREIFGGKGEEKKLQTWFYLLWVFMGKWQEGSPNCNYRSGIWAASWLYHEINYTNSRWDEELLDICRNAIKELDNADETIKQTWNYGFMKLYCMYLYSAIKDNGKSECVDSARILLKKCRYFASEKGWKTALSWLAGKIGLFANLQNENTMYFFKDILTYDKNAEIYYEIAHIYEKGYGDMKKALSYYQKSYECDENYYKALYKFGVALEKKERWIEAVSVYNKIQEIIQKVREKNSTSVLTLEYDYKTCRKIVLICEKYITANKIQEIYEKRLQSFSDISVYVNFVRLMGAMFEDKEAKKKVQEIMKELEVKIRGSICCK